MQHVRIQDVQHRPGKKRPWIARWVVDGATASRSFETKAQANDFTAELRRAARDGQRFDQRTKMPAVAGASSAGDLSIADWCVEHLDARTWPCVMRRRGRRRIVRLRSPLEAREGRTRATVRSALPIETLVRIQAVP